MRFCDMEVERKRQMNPEQIKRREAYGIFTLLTGALLSMIATLMWLLSFKLMVIAGSTGVAMAMVGIFLLVTIPDVVSQEDF